MPAGRAILGNLPVEVTSFVGRRRELRTVRQLLSGARLVTLTGPGGTGKTRLALRVAAEVRRAFTDGVWFVDLTELPEVHLLALDADGESAIAYQIAAVLGLRDEDALPSLRRLADHLTERVVLLVMDNCEHLLPATSVVVAALLRSCPRLRVLVTSREPLAVTGEVIFPGPAVGVRRHLPPRCGRRRLCRRDAPR